AEVIVSRSANSAKDEGLNQEESLVRPGKEERAHECRKHRKLLGLGLPEWAACEAAYSRKAYWRMAGNGVVQRALTKERLI
ncbi:hypothetical protein JQM82_16130, partial [Faecalicatena contorta]|nr:hypothetical protein [Faecalicatena contorta]